MLSTFHNVWIVHKLMKFNVYCVRLRRHPLDEVNIDECGRTEFSNYGYDMKAKKRLTRALYVMAAENYIDQKTFESMYTRVCELDDDVITEG